MKLNVAVVYGGRSGEHEISVRSAKSIIAGLDRERYEVHEYFVSKDGKWSPQAILPEPGSNGEVDVVFPILHGTFGEDGTMQGLFELADLPYVGPGVLASSAGMDKDVFKRLMRDAGLPVVEWVTLTRDDLDAARACREFAFPMFVKPANLGSSVGISKSKNCEELKAALVEAARFDRKVIVERAIAGREFECAVLGNERPEASVPCEILPSREFYDYEDKYLLDKARTELPANLAPELVTEMRRIAVECYKACGAEGMSRVDFFLETSSGKFYINEINTIPGFTSISMYPKMWEHSGIPFSQLLDRLIGLAMDRHAAKKATLFERPA